MANEACALETITYEDMKSGRSPGKVMTAGTLGSATQAALEGDAHLGFGPIAVNWRVRKQALNVQAQR